MMWGGVNKIKITFDYIKIEVFLDYLVSYIRQIVSNRSLEFRGEALA